MVVSVLNQFKFTTISQDKSWKVIYDWVIENVEPNESLVLDFANVRLANPCSKLNEHFTKLLMLNNVNLSITSSDRDYAEGTAKAIELKCILDGYKTERTSVSIIEAPRQITKEEKNIERSKQLYIGQFVREGDEFKFKYPNTTISGSTSIRAIARCVEELNAQSGVVKFVADFNGTDILGDGLEKLAWTIVDLDSKGIQFDADVDRKEYIDALKLYIHREKNKPKSTSAKITSLAKLKNGTVGLLVKYKSSRAVDDFGRMGGGKAAYSKIAIFRGIEDKSYIPKSCENIKVDSNSTVINEKGERIPQACLVVTFDVFNNYSFLTPEGILSENDGEMTINKKRITELPHEFIEIPIDSIGLYSEFLGSGFHFLKPIQSDMSSNKYVVVGMSEEGINIRRKCNLPERIEVVLDSWGIEYDKDGLNECKKAVIDKFGETEQ